MDLKADTANSVQLNVARSSSNVKASVEYVIIALNEFKAELERLNTLISRVGKMDPLLWIRL